MSAAQTEAFGADTVQPSTTVTTHTFARSASIRAESGRRKAILESPVASQRPSTRVRPAATQANASSIGANTSAHRLLSARVLAGLVRVPVPVLAASPPFGMARSSTLCVQIEGEMMLRTRCPQKDSAVAAHASSHQPNPSIERTSSSVLRTLPAAAHVKR